MIAHASIGKLFDLPVVMSTSAQQGPNGPLPKAILEMYPEAPLIKRQGEVDAWDNPEFREAIEATGKKQVIMAGITTDVCKSQLISQRKALTNKCQLPQVQPSALSRFARMDIAFGLMSRLRVLRRSSSATSRTIEWPMRAFSWLVCSVLCAI
jgi:hypothetical protein